MITFWRYPIGTLTSILLAKLEKSFEKMECCKYLKWTTFWQTFWEKVAFKVLSPLDRQTYGRCFTALPTPEMVSYGIKWVYIYGTTEIGVYVHSPGKVILIKSYARILFWHEHKLVLRSRIMDSSFFHKNYRTGFG